MWLTELHAAHDAKAWKLRAAALYLGVVAIDVQRAQRGMDFGHVVGVLGECDGGQPDLDRPPARGLHVALRSVPGELGMDVKIGRNGDMDKPIESGNPACSGPRSAAGPKVSQTGQV